MAAKPSCALPISRTARKRSSLIWPNLPGAFQWSSLPARRFPPIGAYLLTLPPFGFYWFALATGSDRPGWHIPAPEPLPEFVTMVIRDSLAKELSTSAAKVLEDEALPEYIPRRRWFDLKDQAIETTRLTNLININEGADEILLSEVEVKTPGTTTRWFLPLSILWEEDEPSAALPHRLAVARVRRGRRVGLLTDASALPSFAHSFVAALAAGKEFAYSDGVLRFRPTETGRAKLEATADADVNWLAAEYANSALTVGDVAMLKIYRRISAGEHPETEMAR
jgi:maltose alpha-D-glucosyltransferase/alpha-amylase